MRREGSPFQGVGTVAVKEMADHLVSARMFMLELLIVLTALAALYNAIDSLRQTTAAEPPNNREFVVHTRLRVSSVMTATNRAEPIIDQMIG